MLGIKLPKDWDARRIGEIACEVSNRNSANEDLPVLSCTKYDGLVDSLKYFKRKVFSNDISKYKLVPKNHFAYATNHIEEGSIGYQDLYDKALISPIYTVFKTGPKIYDPFLFFLLKTELYRHIFEINTSASVDRRGSLRWKEFSQIEIPLPPAKEQRVIAEILSTWDQAIETLGKLIEAKIKLKKGLMQKLLAGKLRLKIFQKDTRDFVCMGDFVNITTGKRDVNEGNPSGKYPFFTCAKEMTYADTFAFDTEAILISGNGAGVGYCHYYKGKFEAYQRTYVITDFVDFYPRYLLQCLLYDLKRKINFHKQDSATPFIKLGFLQNFKLPKPSIKEQRSIAQVLDNADSEINILSRMLSIFKLQKKGLMQKLLTGKILVKV